jgi:hypothetical protein
MENYGTSLKYAESSMNSAGSAMKKFESYESSIEAATKRLQQSFESLSYNTINSGVVKGFLDFTNVIVKLIDTVGIGNIAILTLASVLGGKGILTTITNLIPFTKRLALNIGILASNMGIAETASVALAKSFAVIIPVAAIMIGIALFDALTTSLEEQRTKVTDLTTELQSLQTEYDNLSGKGDLTEAESKRLELLKAEIEANKIILQQEQQKLYEQEKASKAPKFDRNYISTQTDTISEYNSIDETTATSIEQQDKMIARKAELISQFTEEIKTLQAYKDAGVKISDADEKRLVQLNDIIKAYNLLTEATQASSNTITEIKTAQQALADQYNAGTITLAEYISKLNELKESSREYEKQAYDLGTASEYLASVSKKVAEGDSLTKDEKEQLIALYPDLQNAIYKTADGWTIEQTAVDLLNGSITTLQTAYINAQNAMTELAAIAVGQRLNITDAELKAVQSTADAYALLAGKKGATGTSYSEHELKMWGNITDPTVTNTLALGKAREQIAALQKNLGKVNTPALASNKSSSSPSAIDSQDMASAFIKAANAQSELTKFQGDSLERQIKQAESAKDYAKQIELQNQLLANQKQQIADLGIANEKIHAEADRLRSNSAYGNASNSWFDVNGEASAEYIKLLESFAGKTDKASKQAYESITDLFNSLYKLKQGWKDNTQEVYALQDSISALSTTINQTQRDALQTVSDMEDQIVELYEKEFDEKMDDLDEWYDEKKEKKLLDKRLDDFRRNIQDQKDALQDQQDQESFDKELADKQAELAKIQAQINELSLSAASGDRVANAQLDELKEQLAEKQAEIDEFVSDRSYEMQQDALDNSLSNFEDYIDAQQDLLDEQYEAELANIEKVKQRREDALKEEYSKENLYSQARQILISGEYDEILAKYQTMQEEQGAGWSALGATLETEYLDKLREASILIAQLGEAGISTGDLYDILGGSSGGGSNTGSSGNTVNVGSDGNAPAGTKVGDTVITSGGQHAYLVVGIGDTTATTGGNYNPESNLTSIKLYRDGGVADYTGLAELHGTKTKAETIFNSTDSSKLYELIHGNNVSDIASLMFKNLFNGINGSALSSVVNKSSNMIQIDNLVNIEGSIDSSNLAKIQQSTKDALNEFARKINSNNIILNKGSALI